MKKDKIFLRDDKQKTDFEFNAEVVEVFDDMILRSVPFYIEQQNMIKEIGRKFWISGTVVYDLGCSTATTLINLYREIRGPARFIGYDNSIPMIEKAKIRIKENGLSDFIEIRYGDLNGDLSKISIDNTGLVTLLDTAICSAFSKR